MARKTELSWYRGLGRTGRGGRLGSLGSAFDPSLITDSLSFDGDYVAPGTPGSVTYFDSGAQIQYDENGASTYVNPPGGGVTDTTIYTAGTPTTIPSPQQDQIIVPNDTPANMAANAAAALAANPNARIVLPAGTSAAATNSILSQLAAVAGRFVAQTVGGSTILTRSNNGLGVSTFNLQSLTMPLLIFGGLLLMDGGGGGDGGGRKRKRN